LCFSRHLLFVSFLELGLSVQRLLHLVKAKSGPELAQAAKKILWHRSKRQEMAE